jgi:hypothetical protein
VKKFKQRKAWAICDNKTGFIVCLTYERPYNWTSDRWLVEDHFYDKQANHIERVLISKCKK